MLNAVKKKFTKF